MIVFLLTLLLSFCCCVVIAYSNAWLSIKISLIISLAVASTLVFMMIAAYAGKPVERTLPPDVLVYGQVIDLRASTIYVMYKEVGQPLPPLMLQTPYNKDLQKALAEGRNKTKGKPFRLKTEELGKGGDVGRGKSSQGEKDGKGTLSKQSVAYKVFEVPPPKLPQK